MPETANNLCEERSFGVVFNDYAEGLYRFLYYQTGNEAQAHDLVQEAFTRLWQNCAKVVWETAKGYVFTVAKNLLHKQRDHQRVVLRYASQASMTAQVEDPQFLLEEQELAERLQAAIDELPEGQRVAFLLSRIDKKTYKEIAEILGISRQAVEKRIYAALKSLRPIVAIP